MATADRSFETSRIARMVFHPVVPLLGLLMFTACITAVARGVQWALVVGTATAFLFVMSGVERFPACIFRRTDRRWTAFRAAMPDGFYVVQLLGRTTVMDRRTFLDASASRGSTSPYWTFLRRIEPYDGANARHAALLAETEYELEGRIVTHATEDRTLHDRLERLRVFRTHG